MFNWFKSKPRTVSEDELCKICKTYKIIRMDISHDFCILCVRDYLVNNKPLPTKSEPSKKEYNKVIYDCGCWKEFIQSSECKKNHNISELL
jgi:hypothetical protein